MATCGTAEPKAFIPMFPPASSTFSISRPPIHYAGFAVTVLAVFAILRRRLRGTKRAEVIPKHQERVVVIGATRFVRFRVNNPRVLSHPGNSGIGQEVAIQYASRGAKVCIVGRRVELLEKTSHMLWHCHLRIRPRSERAADEIAYESVPPVNAPMPNHPVVAITADFTNAEDMVNLRAMLNISKYNRRHRPLNFTEQEYSVGWH